MSPPKKPLEQDEALAIEEARTILRPIAERARTVAELVHGLLTRYDNAAAEAAANLFDPEKTPYRTVEVVQTPDGPHRRAVAILESDGEAVEDGQKCRSYRQDMDKCLRGIARLKADTDPEVFKAAMRLVDDGEFAPKDP